MGMMGWMNYDMDEVLDTMCIHGKEEGECCFGYLVSGLGEQDMDLEVQISRTLKLSVASSWLG